MGIPVIDSRFWVMIRDFKGNSRVVRLWSRRFGFEISSTNLLRGMFCQFFFGVACKDI